MAKYIFTTIFTVASVAVLSGCVTQSFENNEPIVKTQANRDEMAVTRISLGLGYLKMGDMSQAKLNLEKAKRFSPNLVQVHTAFAHFYETVGENELANESFKQALAIQADSADTLNNYGVFLCRQQRVEEAEKEFLKAIAVPSYLLVAQSYENLSSCYLHNDNFEKAEMYLHKAIHHSPNRTGTLLQMVRLQYAMGEYQEAREYLQRFERNTQRFTADSLALAYKLYRKLGQRRTASNYGNMLVKMYPESWEAKQYLLNELEAIDADDLAKKYQLTQKHNAHDDTSSVTKRVVKLSPNSNQSAPGVDAAIESNNAAIAVVDSTTNQTNVAPVVAATTSAIAISEQATNAATTVTQVDNTAAVQTVKQAMVNDEAVTTKVAAETTYIGTKALAAVDNTESTIADTNEPTSTKPIAAKRDVPLPEALPPEEILQPVKNIEPIASVADDNDTIKTVDKADAFHIVEPDQNLYNISVKYNVRISALRKWNNISEKNNIRVGAKLYVVDPLTVKDSND